MYNLVKEWSDEMNEGEKFIVLEYIQEFLNSPERELMIKGEKYYRNDNDIQLLDRKSRASHAFMSNLVDEKTGYLLGKEPTIKTAKGSLKYLENVKGILGKAFLYQLQRLATESSNKGIAWEQVYIDDGHLKFMLIPSQEVIPVWYDKSHEKLKWVIRLFPIESYQNRVKKIITKCEVYTETNAYFYIYESGTLILDSEKYLVLKDGEEYGHFTVDGRQMSFGRPPFVWCKNNMFELPDLKFVKDLIDQYDESRNNMSELLEDFKNFLVVLRGYVDDSKNNVSLEQMLKLRRIYIPDTDGGVDLLSPTIDTTANIAHNETLKSDIVLFGRSVDRNKVEAGNSPSGIALKFLYSGLDIKCNHLESGLKDFFCGLMYFINAYLSMIYPVPEEEIEIIFNRDITMNESDAITDIRNSMGIISQETLVENHPYVVDAEEEMRRIKEENSIISNYQLGGAENDQ